MSNASESIPSEGTETHRPESLGSSYSKPPIGIARDPVFTRLDVPDPEIDQAMPLEAVRPDFKISSVALRRHRERNLVTYLRERMRLFGQRPLVIAELPLGALRAVEGKLRRLVVGMPRLPALLVGGKPACIALGATRDQCDALSFHAVSLGRVVGSVLGVRLATRPRLNEPALTNSVGRLTYAVGRPSR